MEWRQPGQPRCSIQDMGLLPSLIITPRRVNIRVYLLIISLAKQNTQLLANSIVCTQALQHNFALLTPRQEANGAVCPRHFCCKPKQTKLYAECAPVTGGVGMYKRVHASTKQTAS